MTTTPRRPRAAIENAAKRLFDVSIAGATLVLLSPVILMIAIAIRLRLGSPVIYRQQRPGLYGQPFTMYKFRSMYDLTDEDGELVDDHERTPPLGRRLRSLSLDELPELWNVVRGDMSLVGPRPLMMQYLERYTPEQKRRHEVRPGITGLAQVSGRNALTWEQKFDLDVTYVDHHDLRMDLDILLRTVKVVLLRDGVRHGDESEDDMPEFMGTFDARTDSDR